MQSILVQSLVGALLLAGGFTADLQAQAKKSATVTLSNLSQTYNGSPRSATATTNAPGVSSFKFTYKGSPVAPTAAGSYSVVCTLVNDKYEGRATGTLVIAKAKATVSLSNLTQTYSGAPRSATATSNATGFSTFTFTYNGSAIAPTAAGSYNLMGKLANANYEGSATGTLVIAKAQATVTLGDLNQTYNATPRSVRATTNATGISSFTFTYNGSAIAPTAAGSYNLMGKLANANYEGSATGTLVISKAKSTTALTLSPSTVVVGQTITLTARVTPNLERVLPSGKVAFKDGNKTIETVSLTNSNGVATATFRLMLTAGTHAFTAVYSGDSNIADSTSTVTKR
jgi:hypothetical protein